MGHPLKGMGYEGFVTVLPPGKTSPLHVEL